MTRAVALIAMWCGGTSSAFGEQVRIAAYSAPARGCPTASSFERAIDKYVDDTTGGDPVLVRVVVSLAQGGYSLELTSEVRGVTGRREFVGRSCAEVVEAAALVVALSLDKLQLSPLDAEPAAIVQSKDSESPPDTPVIREPAVTSRVWPEPIVAVAGTVEAGTLPAPTLGVRARLGAMLHNVQVELGGLVVARQQTSPDLQGRVVEAGLAALSLRSCVSRVWWKGRWAGCIGAEVGRVAARSRGVAAPASTTSIVGGLGGAIGGYLPVTASIAVGAELELVGWLRRPRLVLQQPGITLHEASPLSSRASLAVTVRFR